MVIRMGANGKPTLRLKVDEFDKLAAAVIGAPTQFELARRLGVDPAHLSQLRTGKRAPGEVFIAAVKTAMPNVTFEQLFEVVEAAASDAA